MQNDYQQPGQRKMLKGRKSELTSGPISLINLEADIQIEKHELRAKSSCQGVRGSKRVQAKVKENYNGKQAIQA